MPAVSQIPSDRNQQRFTIFVWLAMSAIAIVMLLAKARNIPITEDWLLVPPLTGNEDNIWGWLWEQNNEHRVPFPRLILLSILWLAGGDFRAGMVFNIITLSALAFIFMRVARDIRGNQTHYVDALFPVAILHLGHWENLFWSWQLSFVVSVILALIILIVLLTDRILTLGGAITAALSLMLLPLCGGTGLLFVPPLTIWFIALPILPRLRKTELLRSQLWPARILLASATITIFLVLFYLLDYETPSWTPPNPGIQSSIAATLQFMAMALGPAARSAWTPFVVAVLLIILSAALVLARAIPKLDAVEQRRALGLTAFLASILLFSLAMGWGRAAVIVIYGSWPIRYVLLAVPILILSFFIWELYAPRSLHNAVQLTLFIGMCLLIPANTQHGLWWDDWYSQGAYALESDIQSGSTLSQLAEHHNEFLFHSISPAQLADYMRMLHEAQLGSFAAVQSGENIAQEIATPVNIQIHYFQPHATRVHLIWGIDGWAPLPLRFRPQNTRIVNKVMHTPMSLHGGEFAVTLQVPQNAIIDFGFLITEEATGVATQFWDADGDRDYQWRATDDEVIKIYSTKSASHIAAVAPNGRRDAVVAFLPFPLTMAIIISMSIYRSQADRLSSLTAHRLIYVRDLVRELVARDIKLRYKESLLGVAWSLLNPLLQLLIFSIVFRYILPLNIPNYTAFLFIGLLMWNWFQASLVAATTTIVDGRSLIKRPGFPIPILPIVTVLGNLIHFLLALPVLLIFLLISGITPQLPIVLLPVIILIQFLFTLSLAYFLATIHVSFRDTQHLVTIGLLFLFYLSPIFYEGSAIPQDYQFVYRLNPILHLLEAYRAILMHGALPPWQPLALITLGAGILLIIGYRLFLRASYFFVEEL